MSKRRDGGYLISQIHQLTGRIFSKKLKEYQIDINHAQGRILFALWKKDQIPINDLSKETSLSKSSLTTMLERLEKSGHIIRKQSEIDKRITIVCLTSKSSSLRSDYQKISSDMINLFYKDFTDDEISKFELSLKKILKNLKNK
ncbi:MAG: MarR family winged helix-turn-helix transcriptional regulator [Bacteroidales bacterium]|jgi:DNA-binding MarR family transcriptional regulator|nr:MarR family winged helix-turn-helix transcriptional regulator [Bacteroidales bacterium]